MLKKPELLAPAGNLEKLKTAVLYGADAVYLGGGDYSLRAQAGNFNMAELAEGIAFAHSHWVKVYVTVNIYAQERHLTNLPQYLKRLAEMGADGIIVADPGVFALAGQVAPQLVRHISTQANTQNSAAVDFWRQNGAKRVVLGREASLQDIRRICRHTEEEIEVFVHGAMCMAYSGRCLLSSYLTGRRANLGDCTQPCRWQYRLEEEKRPGEYFAIEEDGHGSYIFNSKDLCLIDYLPQLMEAGVASFKIEGRMKSSYYVANVTRIYREAIDLCWADPEHYKVRPQWQEELEKVSHRPYGHGFLIEGSNAERQYYRTSAYVRGYDFCGLVLGYSQGRLAVEQRNHLALGDVLEILCPGQGVRTLTIAAMWDELGGPIAKAPHARQKVWIASAFEVPAGTVIRRPVRETAKEQTNEN